MRGDLMGLPELIETVGLSRRTIFRLMRAGKFPKRIKITARKVVWRRNEVDAWLDEKKQIPGDFRHFICRFFTTKLGQNAPFFWGVKVARQNWRNILKLKGNFDFGTLWHYFPTFTPLFLICFLHVNRYRACDRANQKREKQVGFLIISIPLYFWQRYVTLFHRSQ